MDEEGEVSPEEKASEEPEEQEEKEGEDVKEAKQKKKGNWKNIGHEPVSYELHPCLHRWQKTHTRGPCPHYKQIRWVVVPISDRLKQLAMPLLRRLLALWLEFGDKLPPEMRARLLQFMTENYGLSAEFLEQILEEAIKAREAEKAAKERKGKKGKNGKKGKKKKKKKKKEKGGKGKKGKKQKGKNGKKQKGKKENKEKKDKEEKGKKEGKSKKEKESGLLFKKRKAGKLPLDWPYKMGSKFLLTCISYLSKDPDEDYNSRASEYFDVQSMAILELFCHHLEMTLPDPERPTQYGEAIVIMALNLSNWIAKYVTTPAQSIPDDKVEEYLELRGVKPKKPKPPKEKKEKPVKNKKGKKEKEEPKPEPEPETEVQRNWEEHKAPVYVPEKSRISKRKNVEQWEDEEEIEEEVNQEESSPEIDKEKKKKKGKRSEEKTVIKLEAIEAEREEESPEPKEVTLDDIKTQFLEYINWYNPWEPEFMYFGPRKTPEGVSMFKIYDPDTDEVPLDLRVLNWNQLEYGFKDNYSFIPAPVPQYYPSLRPLRPLRFEDLEKSGIPKEIMKQNLHFYSPWYLMSKSLKPPAPPTEPATPTSPAVDADDSFMNENVGEFETETEKEGVVEETEEIIEDEMMEEATREPPIQDSLWGDHVMKEQLDLLTHLLHLMASVPDLTLEYCFELLEEFCEAVELAESDENSMPENKILLLKRTIILEQYFLEFFGKKFRDYNERTPFYMRVICKRCAYYIQLLYEYTARILWELQSRPNPPTPIPSRPETPDDPEALRDWDEWLAWLLKVTKTCDEWAGWITETVNEAERKAAKKKNEFVGPDGKKVPLTEEEWFRWKSQVEQKVFEYRSSKRQIYTESSYYLEKAKHILPVKHRQKICQWVTEDFGEGEEEEAVLGEVEEEEEEEEEEAEVVGTAWEAKEEKKYDDTDGETEWEDVGEVDVE